MPFRFVKISNNEVVFEKNIYKINQALDIGRIKRWQADLLKANNWKCFNICKHKGIIEIKDNKILFTPRTSNEKSLKLPKTMDELKIKTMIPSQKHVEFIKFNKLFNIGNFKWVLGDESNIVVEDFEDRKDVVAKLVGTDEDLAKFKDLVRTKHFETCDISLYFNIEQVIDELAFSNANIIKDE